MSVGYSGNLGFSLPANWMYNQIQEIYSINIDKNVVSHRAEPATRTDVDVVPIQSGEFHPFYWELARLQVQAGGIINDESGPVDSIANASLLLLSWLMEDLYDGTPWKAYIPYIDSYTAGIGSMGAWKTGFKAIAGSRSAFGEIMRRVTVSNIPPRPRSECSNGQVSLPLPRPDLQISGDGPSTAFNSGKLGALPENQEQSRNGLKIISAKSVTTKNSIMRTYLQMRMAG